MNTHNFFFSLTKHIAAFAVVYGIFLSFSALGPGNCTFMLSTKVGPTAVRGHFHGFAAAMGKAGAFTGIWAFPAMIDGNEYHKAKRDLRTYINFT